MSAGRLGEHIPSLPIFSANGGGFWHLLLRAMLGVNLDTLIFLGFFCYMYYESFPNGGELVYVKF